MVYQVARSLEALIAETALIVGTEFVNISYVLFKSIEIGRFLSAVRANVV
jgi:hypothetical protein